MLLSYAVDKLMKLLKPPSHRPQTGPQYAGQSPQAGTQYGAQPGAAPGSKLPNAKGSITDVGKKLFAEGEFLLMVT